MERGVRKQNQPLYGTHGRGKGVQDLTVATIIDLSIFQPIAQDLYDRSTIPLLIQEAVFEPEVPILFFG